MQVVFKKAHSGTTLHSFNVWILWPKRKRFVHFSMAILREWYRINDKVILSSSNYFRILNPNYIVGIYITFCSLWNTLYIHFKNIDMFGGYINEDFWGLVLWFNIIEDNFYNSKVNFVRHYTKGMGFVSIFSSWEHKVFAFFSTCSSSLLIPTVLF